jgi:hypothetical protein
MPMATPPRKLRFVTALVETIMESSPQLNASTPPERFPGPVQDVRAFLKRIYRLSSRLKKGTIGRFYGGSRHNSL